MANAEQYKCTCGHTLESHMASERGTKCSYGWANPNIKERCCCTKWSPPHECEGAGCLVHGVYAEAYTY